MSVDTRTSISVVPEEWDKTIQEKKAPPFTRDNLLATFRVLHAWRADMVERGVIEVFRGLSWHDKTNQPVRFGKHLIVSSAQLPVRYNRPARRPDACLVPVRTNSQSPIIATASAPCYGPPGTKAGARTKWLIFRCAGKRTETATHIQVPALDRQTQQHHRQALSRRFAARTSGVKP